jgi:serine/threonine protein phosphatase PrpC
MGENYFGITDTGRQRDNNEDTFIAEPVFNNGWIAACVIDGVGGYEGGEVAASIAKESILQSFSGTPGEVITTMRNAFGTANENIYQEKLNGDKNRDMACVLTLALVDIPNNKFYYAHVGDTRLYLLRDNNLIKLTKDQSFVGFLEDTGRLTEEAAMTHPKRNEINKALGFDPNIPVHSDYIETGESPFLPGDAILLCSDGLTDMVSSSEITTILVKDASLEQKGKDLIDAANNAGGKDNITVVLVHNNKKPIKQKATKPVVVKKKGSPKNESSSFKTPGKIIGAHPLQKAKNNTGLIVFLLLLSIFSLGGFLWLYWQQKRPIPLVPPIVNTEKNLQEINLQEAINNTTSDTLFLSNSIFGKAIKISDTIWINRDSLYIKGIGNTIVRDSAFASGGPAFIISKESKYIILDSISFQDFNIAILVVNDALQLSNVQFKNCNVSVGYQYPSPDSTNTKDSLPNSSNR